MKKSAKSFIICLLITAGFLCGCYNQMTGNETNLPSPTMGTNAPNTYSSEVDTEASMTNLPEKDFSLPTEEGARLLSSPSGLNIVSTFVYKDSSNDLDPYSDLSVFIQGYFEKMVDGSITEKEAAESVIKKWSAIYTPEAFDTGDRTFYFDPSQDPGTGKLWFFCSYYPERLLILSEDYCIAEITACGFRHLLELRKTNGHWLVTEDLHGSDYYDFAYIGEDQQKAKELFHKAAEKHSDGLTEEDFQEAVDTIRRGIIDNTMYGGIVGDPGTTHDDGRVNLLMESYDVGKNIEYIVQYYSLGGKLRVGDAMVALRVKAEQASNVHFDFPFAAIKIKGKWVFVGDTYMAAISRYPEE